MSETYRPPKVTDFFSVVWTPPAVVVRELAGFLREPVLRQCYHCCLLHPLVFVVRRSTRSRHRKSLGHTTSAQTPDVLRVFLFFPAGVVRRFCVLRPKRCRLKPSEEYTTHSNMFLSTDHERMYRKHTRRNILGERPATAASNAVQRPRLNRRFRPWDDEADAARTFYANASHAPLG